MEFYVRGPDSFGKQVDRIIQDSQKLPDQIRSSIEYNIAEACRRTGQYGLEYSHLTTFIEFADPADPQFTEPYAVALDRLGRYNQLPTDDYSKIREEEMKLVEKVYQRRYKSSSMSFQYDGAMHWIDCLIDLNPQAYQYMEKALLFRHIGKDDKAISLYEIAAEKSTDTRTKSFSLISIALLEAKRCGNVGLEIHSIIASALKSLPEMKGSNS